MQVYEISDIIQIQIIMKFGKAELMNTYFKCESSKGHSNLNIKYTFNGFVEPNLMLKYI